MSIDKIQEDGCTYFHLFASCPICNDLGRSAPRSFWKHQDDDCHGEIYVGDNAFYRCKKCGHSSHVKNWDYICSPDINLLKEGGTGHVSCSVCSNSLDDLAKEEDSRSASAVSTAGQMVSECGLAWIEKFLANIGEC